MCAALSFPPVPPWSSVWRGNRWRSGVLTAVLLVAGCESRPAAPPTTSVPPDAAVSQKSSRPADTGAPALDPQAIAGELAAFNRGAALMEQYRYAEAAAEFEQVVQAFPSWTAARFDLGLAYLNLEGVAKADGRGESKQTLDEARAAFEAVLTAEPDHVPARFVLGLYYQHDGQDAKALECFQAVYDRDPHDPYVVYKLAEGLLSTGRTEEGTKALEQVVAMDPGFVSALYRLGLQYQRARKTDLAKQLLERFKKLSAAELAAGTFVVQKAYGASGKYYHVLGADNLPLPKPTPTAPRILFAPDPQTLDTTSAAWDWKGGKVAVPGVAVGDIDGDGDLDLCLTAQGENGRTGIWRNDGAGRLTLAATLTDQGVSPCLGDVDNDGDLDLWLGRAGGDGLLENDGQGQLQARPDATLAGGEALTHVARLVDLDSDGDLDFLAFRLAAGNLPCPAAARAAAGSVFNNNRDGTFVDRAQDLGLAAADSPVAAVVYDDFDSDRDLDLLLFFADDRPPVGWVNDRVGSYHLLDAATSGCSAARVRSATSGDFDKDGDRDLLVFTDAGVRLYGNGGRFRFAEQQAFTRQHGQLSGTGGQFADLDNDGDLDIVIGDAERRNNGRGPVLLVNDWPREGFTDAGQADPGNLLNALPTAGDASCVVADFTGDGKCDILLAPGTGKPVLVVNATPGGHWIALDLRGTSTPDNQSRSNASAVGARVEIKTGAVLQQFVVGGNSGAVAMPPLRVHAGLGENTQVDWLRILWPDAVLQAELELPADRVQTVTELQRKTSSCPYLFAWNGTRFEFVSDFGGVGGLGYWTGPDQYAAPDPTEYVRIPHLEPRAGEYVLQCVTPLEEVTYLDEAKLLAVDHPDGTEVHPHEMMAVRSPPPAFAIFCFRQRLLPVRATDHRGVDVTEELRHIDRRCAGATDLDHRFLGLAAAHHVELDFGDQLQTLRPQTRLILSLYGWVEYGYSSTNYAAHQAGLRPQAPTIAVFRGGRWVDLFPEVGYPAGVNHLMTLDVTGQVLPGDERLRISSTMELYWDCIFLAEDQGGHAVTVQEVAARSAALHFRGYPREYSPDGRRPNLCDYDNTDRTVAWKLMAGQYTRYGEVTELVHEADDCFVILGHGEEVTLRFAADAFGPVPPGCRRTFLLKTDSYCKDMDLCTAYPDTVDPLPFHAMSRYPYGPDERYPDTAKTRDYQARYNTRRIGEARTIVP